MSMELAVALYHSPSGGGSFRCFCADNSNLVTKSLIVQSAALLRIGLVILTAVLTRLKQWFSN